MAGVGSIQVDEPQEWLCWSTVFSRLTGRVVALTLESTTFPQERFLSQFADILQNADALAIKVYYRNGATVKVIKLGNEFLGDDDLSEDYD